MQYNYTRLTTVKPTYFRCLKMNYLARAKSPYFKFAIFTSEIVKHELLNSQFY